MPRFRACHISTLGSRELRYAGTSSLIKGHIIALDSSCHQERNLMLGKHVSVQKAAYPAFLQPIIMEVCQLQIGPNRKRILQQVQAVG